MCFPLVIISTHPVLLISPLLWFYLSDGTKSEVTLYHPEEIICFLNMDDTQHSLSTKGRKGAMKYHNPRFNQPGDRGVDSSRHITWCYTTNLLEVIPPLYIFDSKAENSGNFKIEPYWVEGFPTVTGKFGLENKFLYHYSVAVRQRVPWMIVYFGSMLRRFFWKPIPMPWEQPSETI